MDDGNPAYPQGKATEPVKVAACLTNVESGKWTASKSFGFQPFA